MTVRIIHKYIHKYIYSTNFYNYKYFDGTPEPLQLQNKSTVKENIVCMLEREEGGVYMWCIHTYLYLLIYEYPIFPQVYMDGSKRRASEYDRRHPPGSATCLDAQRAAESRDKEQAEGGFKGM